MTVSPTKNIRITNGIGTYLLGVRFLVTIAVIFDEIEVFEIFDGFEVLDVLVWLICIQVIVV